MSGQALGDLPAAASSDGGVGGVLRGPFRLVDGRLLVMLGLWLAVAFVLRPFLIGAHLGDAGAGFEWIRGRMDPQALARATGMVEWASFAFIVGILAVLHVRAASARATGASERFTLAWAAAYAVLLPVAFVVFLWDRASVITLMTHDTFIFMDAVHRIQSGQAPSVDFHTPIGVVALYGPAVGAWLSGGYAGSVEIASAIVALFLGLACAWICASRLPSGVSSVLVVLVFMAVAPMALLGDWPGSSVTIVDGQPFLLTDQLTHAMFYNRWGWGGLIVAFVFLIPREDRIARDGEIALFAGVLAFLFYLKLSYFVVAVGAAGAYALLHERPWRTLMWGGGGALLVILLIGLPGGLLFGYLSEVASAASISGNRLNLLASVLRGDMLPLLLSVAPLGVMAFADKIGWRDWLVAGVIIVGSLFIINQNAQTGAICTLIVLTAYGAARLADGQRGAQLAVLGAFILLAAPPILERMMVLMDRSTAIRREEARVDPQWSDLDVLRGFHVAERESELDLIAGAETQAARIEALSVLGWMRRRQELRQGEYMTIVRAGVADLRTVIQPGESVVTLDMSNPFSALLGSRPADGDWLSLHAGRTFSAAVHPPADEMFADADHVMIAKISLLQPTADLADEIYGAWLTANYSARVETTYWVRYSGRREAGAQGLELRGFTAS